MEEKRKCERRKKINRRTGELDTIYKRLVLRGIIADSRKGERRKGDRRNKKRVINFSSPTHEESYVLYMVGMQKTNSERQRSGLTPLPVLSFKEWLKSK